MRQRHAPRIARLGRNARRGLDGPFRYAWSWAVLPWLCCLLAVAPAIAADPARLVVTVPAQLAADGESETTLTVSVVPSDHPLSASDLRLTATAGTLGVVRPIEAGKFQVTYTPPRIARTTDVQFVVTSPRIAGTGSSAIMRVLRSTKVTLRQSAGPLEMRAPDSLVLGADTEAEISIKNVPGVKIVSRVNVGSLSEFVAAADGRLHARYTPPSSKFPQVAIAAAMTEDGSIVDWLPVVLYGQPQVNAATEADSVVRARVGSLVFGPFRADASGRTRIDVLAPPGINSTEVTATDLQGSDHTVNLPLGAPAFARSLAVCAPAEERLMVFALDDRGAPQPGLNFVATASNGTVTVPRERQPGLYDAAILPLRNSEPGKEILVSANVAGQDAYRVSCKAVVQGEAPSSIELRVEPPFHLAGSGTPIRIEATLRYPGKRSPRKVGLEAETDLGSLSNKSAVTSTQLIAQWTLPDRLRGKPDATVSIRAPSLPALAAKTSVQLRSARTARVEVTTQIARAGTGIVVRVFDAFDNPGPGAKLVARASGMPGEFLEGTMGTYQATYAPPSNLGVGFDEVEVRDTESGITGRTSIALRAFSRPLTTWVRVGYITNFGRLQSPVVAGGVAGRLPVASFALSLGVEGGYHAGRSTSLEVGTGEAVSSSLTAVPVMGRAAIEKPIGPFVPYVGLASGAILSRAEVSSRTTGKIVRGATGFGICGLAGASTFLGPGRVGLEVGYLHAVVAHAAMTGNLGGLQVSAAYHIDL